MTSLTRNKKFKNQEGVTLLLTILVLVAISALTFSFASIAFNEVKTSGGISDSEPAITGAEAVTEDLLYKSVRGFIATCGTTETDTLSSSGVTVNAISSYYQPNPWQLHLNPNQEVDMYFFNPCNQYDDPGFGNTSIYLENTVTAFAQTHFCSWNLATCLTNGDLGNPLISAGNTQVYNMVDGTKYEIIIVNGPTATNAYITTTVAPGSLVSPSGVPAEALSIVAKGIKGGQIRSLQTLLPQ